MSGPVPWTIYESPLGPLTLHSGPRGLTALHFPGGGVPLDEENRAPLAFAEPARQLEEYFAGYRQRFELALDLGGTPFQRTVWQRLLAIPYGSTVSYTALARALGRPGGVRAVAAAVGRTPVPVIVPCHRVVASDGALTGYLGGLQRKQALLDLERRGATGVGHSTIRPGPVNDPACAGTRAR
ncbi:MAG: methylated-DNA--[protein]-cysteine S-methyltransferase [Solirubrobacteraceae bacterium MAG38_C4-C5]|nr:methylated-DNA--[protein]-cysteine S-methyltransferase [Candidatus Siliceabacter maunaloa]